MLKFSTFCQNSFQTSQGNTASDVESLFIARSERRGTAHSCRSQSGDVEVYVVVKLLTLVRFVDGTINNHKCFFCGTVVSHCSDQISLTLGLDVILIGGTATSFHSNTTCLVRVWRSNCDQRRRSRECASVTHSLVILDIACEPVFEEWEGYLHA